MKRTKILQLRQRLEQMAQHIPEIEAYDAVWLYPEWTESGSYTAGKVWQHDGLLWRCRQDHTGQAGYEPSVNTASLWELIPRPGESGTLENPIAYSSGMALEKDKYYSQGGVVYLCIRGSGIPVYADLSALVGNYVEVVS